MKLELFFALFSQFLSPIDGSHFLGGSFTYRPYPLATFSKQIRSILVEIRFHISNHYFLCSSEQVNQHLLVYLIGERIPFDQQTQTFLWHHAEILKTHPNFYRIQCQSSKKTSSCQNFNEEVAAFCQSANPISGYSILRRVFLLHLERFQPVELSYRACCWANSSTKPFQFALSIETNLNRSNSSPYPHIPASYYVDFRRQRVIKVFAFDADGDQILCESFNTNLAGFLTIEVTASCELHYKANRLGKQFGHFWLMDQDRKKILSKSLISVQIDVIKDVLCSNQSELIVQNLHDRSSKATIEINQSISISVHLRPHCLLIEPQDQTITELTTLCQNNQPIVQADGGIEVIFQCQANLCEKHQVCFIGEFAAKLASSEVQCFVLDVVGSETQCADALKQHDFLKPPDRNFVIAPPVILTPPAVVSVKTRGKPSSSKSTSTIASRTTTNKPAESRKWLLPVVVLVVIGLLAALSPFVWKTYLSNFYRNFTTPKEEHKPSISSSRGTMLELEKKSEAYETLPPTALANEQDELLDSLQPAKVRSQHVRLGPFDDN